VKTNLTCDDIRQTIQTGATLLDVRTNGEFQHNALPDAKNIPLAVLPLLADEHFTKDDHVLVYCQAGARAIMAEKILTGLGFTNVTNLGSLQTYQHCH
jgi:rhodanese-related sulfurtransferase